MYMSGKTPSRSRPPARAAPVSELARTYLFDACDRVQKRYEDMINQQRANDGTHKRKFSCRVREGGLSIANCVRVMLTMGTSDVYTELTNSNLFPPTRVPDPSNFVQTRDDIPTVFFEDMFKDFVEEFYWKRMVATPVARHQWRFYAIDGSEASYPENKDEEGTHVKPKTGDSRSRNAYHINAMICTDTNMFVDLLPQEIHSYDEHDAAYQFMERLAARFSDDAEARRHCVEEMDRGYESWQLFTQAERLGLSFLVRAKEPASKGVLYSLQDQLPMDHEEFDADVAITLTRSLKKAKARSSFHFIPGNVRCKECTRDEDCRVEFRVIKVKLGDNSFEYLISNLPRGEFPLSVFKKVYFYRWKVEIGFLFVKTAVGLIYFHAKKGISVMKEIWSRFLTYNFIMLVCHDASVRFEDANSATVDNNKVTKINVSNAVADAKRYLRCNEKYDLSEVICRHKVPVRKNRIFERDLNSKKAIPFTHRAK